MGQAGRSERLLAGRPARAAIDPRNLLIDLEPRDNVTEVQHEPKRLASPSARRGRES